MTTIDYWFTPQSPFAYLGHDVLREIAHRRGAHIRALPADFARIFAATGGVPLAQRPPARQAYRLHELRRWAEYRVLPLRLQPSFFPVDPTAASRLIIATEHAHGSERALDLAGALMRAVWAEDRNIADSATLIDIANAQDLPGALLMPASMTDAVQQRLDANTEAAISAGVFGAPTYQLDGEPFWGQDRLEFLERALVRHA